MSIAGDFISRQVTDLYRDQHISLFANTERCVEHIMKVLDESGIKIGMNRDEVLAMLKLNVAGVLLLEVIKSYRAATGDEAEVSIAQEIDALTDRFVDPKFRDKSVLAQSLAGETNERV